MFDKILVANRSEIAERVMRTCAEMGIATVAVFTEHDADAPFVHAADEAVPLPEGAGYLDGAAIVEAALRVHATGIHPGYGFLAESATFAGRVADAGLVFIGPPASVIEMMGSKLRARRIMQDAGVPVLAAAEIPEGSDLHEVAASVGYPLVVKASSGGGGKGMRIVTGPDDLTDAVAGAAREAASAFGDGTVYLERFIERARHIEVQILADAHGNVAHLYERECSLQRRFQKVIEEAPAPDLDDAVRSRLWRAGVDAARAVGYRGVGTVEFIVGRDGEVSFLEMNTRLQVEHPVTEMTTGVDLVRIQIDIAEGRAIPAQEDLPPVRGHAIEARLYAESPADGFRPSTGTIHRFAAPPGVRSDVGVRTGSVVTHHYDPMLGKMIAHADTRRDTARKLARSLARTVVHGVETNRDLLIAILEDPAFTDGPLDTGYLERHLDALLDAARPARRAVRDAAAAAALARQAANRRSAKVLATIPSGWRNVRSGPEATTLVYRGAPIDVRYVVSDPPAVSVDGEDLDLSTVYRIEAGVVDVAIDGVRRRFDVQHVGDEVFVDGDAGSFRFSVAPRFRVEVDAVAPGAMVARTPGVVVAAPVSEGDRVAAGDTVMVVEAMKMEQAVVAPAAGVVSAVHYGIGDQVEAGAVLAEVVEEDADDA